MEKGTRRRKRLVRGDFLLRGDLEFGLVVGRKGVGVGWCFIIEFPALHWRSWCFHHARSGYALYIWGSYYRSF